MSGLDEVEAALVAAQGHTLTTNTPMGYILGERRTMTEITYSVPDLSCGHCRTAVTSALEPLGGVQDVDVDLDAKRVVVRGDELDDSALREALASAGYEAE